MLKSFSNNFILSSLELSFQLSNAFFAASTAALVSSFEPSEKSEEEDDLEIPAFLRRQKN